MKLSDCKNKSQVNEFLKGGVWNLNGEQIARDQIVVERHKGVYTAYDKKEETDLDYLGELFSSPDEARLAQIEGWMEFLEEKNKELQQKLDKNNQEIQKLKSEAKDLKLYLMA